MPVEEDSTQNFSFGDFTQPVGEPPLRNSYHMAWNQLSCMNHMYNWNSPENYSQERTPYDVWNQFSIGKKPIYGTCIGKIGIDLLVIGSF